VDPARAREICIEVFDSWVDVLEGVVATPLLVVAVAHGADPGRIHLAVRDDPSLTEESIVLVLLEALRLLDRRIQERGSGSRPASSGPVC